MNSRKRQRNPSSAISTTDFPRLNLPAIDARIVRSEDGIVRIFDSLRQCFVALTPEEWVRQHFTAYMIDSLGYPVSLMANEVSLKFNGMRRRCDTVLYARQTLLPQAIVEYKAPHIEITQRVFDQIARYNLVMGAPLLIVSNGLTHYCCMRSCAGDAVPYHFLHEIPSYQLLLQLLNS